MDRVCPCLTPHPPHNVVVILNNYHRYERFLRKQNCQINRDYPIEVSPLPAFRVSGLEKDSLYRMELFFLADHSNTEFIETCSSTIHPMWLQTGSWWMGRIIKFDDIKCVNKRVSDDPTNFRILTLNQKTKYSPQLIISKMLPNNPVPEYQLIFEHPLVVFKTFPN